MHTLICPGRESSRIAAFVSCELSPVSRWAVRWCSCFWVIPAPVSDSSPITHTILLVNPIKSHWLYNCYFINGSLSGMDTPVCCIPSGKVSYTTMCECMHAYVYMHAYKNTSMYTYIYTQKYINMSDCAHTCTYIHAHMQSHTCILIKDELSNSNPEHFR